MPSWRMRSPVIAVILMGVSCTVDARFSAVTTISVNTSLTPVRLFALLSACCAATKPAAAIAVTASRNET